jgi:hypothetical protein
MSKQYTLEFIQGKLDQTRAAIKEVQTVETRLLDLLVDPQISADESHEIVRQIISTSEYFTKLNSAKAELQKIRDSIIGGKNE